MVRQLRPRARRRSRPAELVRASPPKFENYCTGIHVGRCPSTKAHTPRSSDHVESEGSLGGLGSRGSDHTADAAGV